MTKIDFFPPALQPTLAEVAAWTGAAIAAEAPRERVVRRVAPLDQARFDELSFFENRRYLDQLRGTRAGAVLLAPGSVEDAPPGCVTLASPHPYHAMAAIMQRLYPSALKPGSTFGAAGIAPNSSIHPTARLEPGVVVDPGAVVGPEAEIGAGTLIDANAVIGPKVRIGRNCSIGPQVSILCALVGDRVVVLPGLASAKMVSVSP